MVSDNGFVNFLIGFVIRVPFVPFHNWYPDIQSKAAAPVNILLAGMLLNTGVYGLIRFNMQVFPQYLNSLHRFLWYGAL